MIILFEGPDGTGKTTLAKNLANRLIDNKETCLFIHCTNNSQDKNVTVEEGYERLLKDLNYWRSLGYNVIIDRAWVSNIVYSSVFEPDATHISNKLSEELFKAVDKAIICLPADKARYMKQFENLAKNREEAYTENMDKVYDLFNDFAKKHIRYDMFKHLTNRPETIKLEDIND